MSTHRYSGEIRIRVTYLDVAYVGPDTRARHGNGRYRCFLRGPDGKTATVTVNAPRYLSHAVDSPEAFDDAARAALSFTYADPEVGKFPDGYNWAAIAANTPDGNGWHVGRSEARAWPRDENGRGRAP